MYRQKGPIDSIGVSGSPSAAARARHTAIGDARGVPARGAMVRLGPGRDLGPGARIAQEHGAQLVVRDIAAHARAGR